MNELVAQLVPLGELGILFGIYRRLGQLREDTNKNENRIKKLRSHIEGLKKRVERIENARRHASDRKVR